MALRELCGASAPERDRISAAKQGPAVPGAAVARRRGPRLCDNRVRGQPRLFALALGRGERDGTDTAEWPALRRAGTARLRTQAQPSPLHLPLTTFAASQALTNSSTS